MNVSDMFDLNEVVDCPAGRYYVDDLGNFWSLATGKLKQLHGDSKGVMKLRQTPYTERRVSKHAILNHSEYKLWKLSRESFAPTETTPTKTAPEQKFNWLVEMLDQDGDCEDTEYPENLTETEVRVKCEELFDTNWMSEIRYYKLVPTGALKLKMQRAWE